MIGRSLDRAAPWAVAVATFAACMAFRPEYPTDWDSIQLMLGVDRFDITHHSPHPPGYWLYVFLGRVVRWATPFDTAASLTLLSAGAAGAAAGLTYVVGRRWSGPWLGACAAAFVATSPFVLFFGAIPSTYTAEMLVAVVLVLLAASARPGSAHAWVAAGVLGLAGGIRQTVLVLLAPVVLYAAVRSVRSVRAGLAMAGAAAAGVLAWLVPTLVEQPGGWARYRAMADGYVSDTLGHTSILGGATRNDIVNNLGQAAANIVLAVLALLPAAAAGAALFVVARGHGRSAPRFPVLLALTVVTPALFFAVVHFGKSGYVLASLPGLVLLLLWVGAQAQRGPRLAVTALVVLACLVNVQRFVAGNGIVPTRLLETRSLWFTQSRHGAPYTITRAAMDATDRTTRAYLALGEELDPRTDALVYVLGNGAQRFRHAGYTLPEFTSHFVQPGGVRWGTQAARVLTETEDHVVPVPPGGRAVFVLDGPTEEVVRLEMEGRVVRHQLRTGPSVWIARPGTVLFGVTVVDRP